MAVMSQVCWFLNVRVWDAYTKDSNRLWFSLHYSMLSNINVDSNSVSLSPDIEKTKNWIKKTKKTVWERMAIFVNKYDRRQWGSWCFFTLTPNTYTPHYETPEFGAIFNLHRLLYKSSVKTRLWQYIFCIAVSLYPCEDTQCIHTYSTILCSKCPSDLFRSVCIVKTGHNNQ